MTAAQKPSVRYWLRVTASVAIALIMFFPIYWLLISSLKPMESLFRGATLLPSASLFLENYERIFTNGRFWRFFFNSSVVGVVATSATVALSILGGYGLARFTFWGSRTFANTVLFVYMVPKVLLAIPIYVWMFEWGLLDSYAGLTIAHIAEGLPFALWMFRGFFASLPKELEDSARIDGCTWLGALVRIILPLSGSGIVVVAMYTLITSWNDYLFAFMLINSGRLQTLPVGLTVLFESADTVEWGPIMAGAIITTLPVLLLFLLLQRLLVRGLTAGAVKG